MSLQLKRPEVAVLAAVGRNTDEIVGFVTRCEIFVDWSCSPGREELVIRFADLRITSLQPAPVVMNPCDVQMVRNSTAVAGIRMAVDFSPVYFTFSSSAFSAITSVSFM